ncbi:unnamed protein product, partial [Schistosoma turkestanicum]
LEETPDHSPIHLIVNTSPTHRKLSPMSSNLTQSTTTTPTPTTSTTMSMTATTTPKHFSHSWLDDETTPSPLIKRLRLSNNTDHDDDDDKIISNCFSYTASTTTTTTTTPTDIKNYQTEKSILSDSVVDFITANSFTTHHNDAYIQSSNKENDQGARNSCGELLTPDKKKDSLNSMLFNAASMNTPPIHCTTTTTTTTPLPKYEEMITPELK